MTPRPLENKRPVVVGLGEVLWDIFPDGARFGGAPANFACHAASLGANASIVSVVGNDDIGDQAIKSLKDHGVDTSCVTRCDHPTGTVHVTTAGEHFKLALNQYVEI